MTKSQKRRNLLEAHGPDIYKVFVESDRFLLTSTCSCCKKKRMLARKIVKRMLANSIIDKLPKGADWKV